MKQPHWRGCGNVAKLSRFVNDLSFKIEGKRIHTKELYFSWQSWFLWGYVLAILIGQFIQTQIEWINKWIANCGD